jgi:hypothetical protein
MGKKKKKASEKQGEKSNAEKEEKHKTGKSFLSLSDRCT